MLADPMQMVGLDGLHSREILHRDIKPSNLNSWPKANARERMRARFASGRINLQRSLKISIMYGDTV